MDESNTNNSHTSNHHPDGTSTGRHHFDPNPTPSSGHKKKGLKDFSPKKLWRQFKSLPKKQKIIIIFSVLLIVLIGVVLWLFVFRSSDQPAATIGQLNEQEAPKTVPSELTGLPVKPEVNSEQVTAVMIENSPDARPQSGLSDAGLVFEAIAEAGITRFMALYQDTDSNYIGPVRSARPYYVHWLLPFDAAYAHVGGSPDALNLIRQRGVKDLDQFSSPASYERVSSRYAPHNVYTSTGKLNSLEKERGFDKSSYTGFMRKPTEDPADKPQAKTINLNISSELYNVRFDYKKSSNVYARTMAGQPHKDEKSGKQIGSKVVVVMVMDRSLDTDGYHTIYRTKGKGRLFVFQDGRVIKGKWSKKDANSQFKLTDDNGETVSLTPGKTWVTVVSATNQVKYKP